MKHRAFLLLSSIVLLTAAFAIVGRPSQTYRREYARVPGLSPEDSKLQTTPTIPPNIAYRKIPVLSPDPDIFASLRTEELESGGIAVMPEITNTRYDIELIRIDKSEDVSVVDRVEVDNQFATYRENLDSGKNNVLAWSSDKRQLAFLVPHQLVVYSIRWSQDAVTAWEGSSYNQVVATITDRKEFTVPVELSFVWFSGDGTQVYLGNEYMIDLDTTLVTALNRLPEGGPFFPIPNSKGYASLMDTTIQGNVTTYELPKGPYDYPGSVLFSPNHKAVCVDYGVSGSWGYLVGKIEGRQIKRLLGGLQYSYCVRWVNANEILLQEEPYWGYGSSQYYLFNTATQKKTFLFEETIKK